MILTVDSVGALEILDSRGRPTLEVTATLSDGTTASAQVPSGASTGRHEALELRDGDRSRYAGLGVRKAAAHVDQIVVPEIRGMEAHALQSLDAALIELDGTRDKSRLGANCTLGVSCAVARALAASERTPLWQMLARIFRPSLPPVVPRPMVNILSGGHHAAHNIEIQDFLVVPLGFQRYSDALQGIVAIHGAAREVILGAGLVLTGVADEGGWGPSFQTNEAALGILTRAIESAGFRPGEDFGIAVDVASSHFHSGGRYILRSEERSLSADDFIDVLDSWKRTYPLLSLEDALDQDDWDGWTRLTSRLGGTLQLIGDDFFTTSPGRVRQGIAERAANAVLVKMNQIGTLTETFEVVELAAQSGWRAVISARSGETEDSFLADLATASGAGQIKIGSITRSERLAKYNRLLRIEQESGLSYAGATPFGPIRAD